MKGHLAPSVQKLGTLQNIGKLLGGLLSGSPDGSGMRSARYATEVPLQAFKVCV